MQETTTQAKMPPAPPVTDTIVDVNVLNVMRKQAEAYEECKDERGLLAGNVQHLISMLEHMNGTRVILVSVH